VDGQLQASGLSVFADKDDAARLLKTGFQVCVLPEVCSQVQFFTPEAGKLMPRLETATRTIRGGRQMLQSRFSVQGVGLMETFVNGTILGHLKVLEVYEYYDGPRLFASSNQLGLSIPCALDPIYRGRR